LTEGFSAEAQAWLDHGFAFMSVNYHGSTTFGRDFQQSIQGALGTVEVDDMAAARAWAVGEGVARPDQVLVSGLSYGGYLTLQAMGRRPELWAGGIATVAIADWALMYEDQAPTLRGSQVAFFGGTPDETAYATRVASPITYADDFAAPILVIQGRNDTRCPARQMEAFVAKLTARGKDISVHWFDAGHGSLRVSEQIEHMALSLAFARRVIDERP
jgi:dipeptidyl aminopeptidase/acylaminoacyl peptidase